MAVYFVATVALAFYLAAIPVKFAFLVQIRHSARFGAGLAIFENRFALRSAQKRLDGPKKARPKQPDARLLSAAWQAGKYLFRKMRWENFGLHGRLGLPDAAATALACGCAGVLKSALPSKSVQISLQPDFSGSSDLAVSGMVSLRAGHIMLAALIGAWKYISGGKKNGTASH